MKVRIEGSRTVYYSHEVEMTREDFDRVRKLRGHDLNTELAKYWFTTGHEETTGGPIEVSNVYPSGMV